MLSRIRCFGNRPRSAAFTPRRGADMPCDHGNVAKRGVRMIQNLLSRLVRREDRPSLRLTDRDRRAHTAQAIPCVVYQTWEDDLFGATHVQAMTRFRDANPDLDFRLFQGGARRDYMRDHWGDHPIRDLYDRARFGPMKADIFRYCLLYDRGGYYFDISKGCDTRLTSLHPPEAQALLSAGGNDEPLFPPPEVARHLQHPHKRLIQWALGFVPGHPILKAMIANICAAAPFFERRSFDNPKNAILMLTGPGMYNQTVRSVLAERGAEGIAQCGIDLNGHGIYELPGSRARFRTVPHYVAARDVPILD